MSPTPTRKTSRGRSGIEAEAVARHHLETLGWTILAANLVVGRGELDVVALDPDDPGTLVVVEVRGARTHRFGAPEESVDGRKLGRLRTTTFLLLRSGWLAEQGIARPGRIRIDVIAVRLDPTIASGTGGPAVRHLRGVTPE